MKKARMVLVLMMAIVMLTMVVSPPAAVAAHNGGDFKDVCVFSNEPNRFGWPCHCEEFPFTIGEYNVADCKDAGGTRYGCKWKPSYGTVTTADGVRPIWRCSKTFEVTPLVQTAKPRDYDPNQGRADWIIMVPPSIQSLWVYAAHGSQSRTYGTYLDEFTPLASRVFHYAGLYPFGPYPYSHQNQYHMQTYVSSSKYGQRISEKTAVVYPPGPIEFKLD